MMWPTSRRLCLLRKTFSWYPFQTASNLQPIFFCFQIYICGSTGRLFRKQIDFCGVLQGRDVGDSFRMQWQYTELIKCQECKEQETKAWVDCYAFEGNGKLTVNLFGVTFPWSSGRQENPPAIVPQYIHSDHWRIHRSINIQRHGFQKENKWKHTEVQ